MTPFFLLAIAATAAGPATPSIATMPGGNARRFEACIGLTKTDPAKAVEQASEWHEHSGGVVSAQCLGLAFVAQARWAPAAAAFEQAAREAEQARDGRAATLWVQAGNAALAGDDPARARDLLDRALALPVITGAMRGEVWLDRARANAALKDLKTTRADLDEAAKLVPGDPLLWLLSATLARRQGDLPRAGKDIAQALKLAPDEGSVAYEAGNIAATKGEFEAAKLAWRDAVRLDAAGSAGKAAAALLAAPQGTKIGADALDGA